MRGKAQREAYRIAFLNTTGSDATVDKAASRLIRTAGVARRVDELQLQASNRVLLSREERMQLLAEDILLPSKTAADRNARSRGIEVLNKTAGDCQADPDDPQLPAPGDELGKRRMLNVTVNIFQNSPANVRKESADALGARLPAMTPAEKTSDANGNSHGSH